MTSPVPRRGAAPARAAVAVCAALLAVPVTGLVAAAPADAHAVLVSSTPTDGARLDTAPSAVRLTFDESIQLIPGAAQVITTTGTRVDTGHPRLTGGGTTIVMTLRPDLPRGSYAATWRVVSADTHVVSGSISFGIGQSPSAVAPVVPDHTRQLGIADDAAQGLVYAGIVLLLGLSAVLRVLWSGVPATRRTRALAWSGWILLLVGTLAALLLQGPRADNQGWSGFFGLHGLGRTAGSGYGAELLTRLALLLLIVPLLTMPVLTTPPLTREGRPSRAAARDVPAALLGAGIVVTVALAGHEAVGTDVALALSAAIAHLLAMAVWLGGLAALGLVVLPAARRGRSRIPARSLHRWSATAYTCVGCLVVTGEYQASRQITPPAALWSTRYGIVLLIKAGIVALIVAAAYLAQRRVAAVAATGGTTGAGASVPAAAAVPPRTARVVERSVRIELALAAAVLAATSILVAEPPAATAYGPAVDLSAPLGPDRALIHVAPTRRGPQRFDLRIVDATGRPAAAETVTATLSSAGVSSLAVRLVRGTADGSAWHSSAAVVPLPGAWTLTLTVSLDAADAYATSAIYEVW